MTRRLDRIKESGIRKIFDNAAGMSEVVNLSIGQPDFEVPEDVKKSMNKALIEGKTRYTPSAGIKELRNKILEKYRGRSFAESALVTAGVTSGIFLAYSALLEEGDELIILEPYFVVYPDLCSFLGAKPVIVETNEDFSINPEMLRKAVTSRTKAIMVNTPCNPSGKVFSRQEMNLIAEIAEEHSLWIISDEVYEIFDYEGKFTSAGDVYEKAIILNGFSKSHAMTGLRLGYAVGPKQVIDSMVKLHQYTFVCAPSIAQYAVAENFDVCIDDEIKKLKEKRDYIFNRLRNHFEVGMPEGAFYLFIKLPHGIDGDYFVQECLNKGLLVVPGASFGKSDCVRVSYAAEEGALREGADILIKVVQRINDKNESPEREWKK